MKARKEKNPMKSPAEIAILLAALACVPAAAQVSELAPAYDAARAAVSAAAKPAVETSATAPAASAAAPTSCDDAKSLEAPFEFALTPADGGAKIQLRFEYAGCEEFPRNDYLAPYTQRSYEAKGGYGMTILVDEDGRSAGYAQVLFSSGKNWIGNMGFPVEALVSGDPQNANLQDHEQWNKINGRATLRDAAKPLYPQLGKCEAADWSKAAASAPARTNGIPALGWDGRSGPSLVLLTKTAAYYYHEDCDICAEVTRCELSNGALSSAKAAHSVDCADMKPFEKDAVYDACAESR